MIKEILELTVYFDGQFYIGLFERKCRGRISACRYVFGAEPKDSDVFEFVTDNFDKLKFSPFVQSAVTFKEHKNPKPRKRKIKQSLADSSSVGTKSQQAIKKQTEERKTERKNNAKIRKEEEAEEAFQKRQHKKKEKHNGH